MMDQPTAIKEENRQMDELARLSEEIETVNLLIVHFADRPNVGRRLSNIRARLLELKYQAMQDRAWASQQI